MSYQNLKSILQALNKPRTRVEITKLLSITPDHVDKLLNFLMQQDLIELKSFPNDGYKLKYKHDFLNKEYIEISIRKFETNCNITIFDTIDSTNNYLLKHSSTENNKLGICLAEMQTNGKGRLKRTWLSPFGQNIYMSLSLKTTQALAKLSQLSLVVGLSIVKILNSFQTGFKIKWPNDIYYNTKKISGVLIETKPCVSDCTLVVIGIGVNINMLPETRDSWSSLRHITGHFYDRNNIVPILIKNIVNYFNLYLNNDFATFDHEWKRYDLLCNRTITVSYKNNIETGGYIGINQNGQILLNSQNRIKAIPIHYSVNVF